MNADTVTAWATCIYTAVTAGALFYAGRQLKVAREASEQARQLADEAALPYVVAYIEPSEVDNHMIDLVIANFGPTGARDVGISPSPPLMRSGKSEEAPPEPVVLPARIPFLPPGGEWRTFWDNGPRRKGLDIPGRHEIVLCYLDSSNQQHCHRSEIDWDTFDGRQWVPVRTVHHLVTSLNKVAGNLGRMRALKGPELRVLTWDGEEEMERRAQQERADQAETDQALRHVLGDQTHAEKEGDKV